jgi:hypothetical protein
MTITGTKNITATYNDYRVILVSSLTGPGHTISRR